MSDFFRFLPDYFTQLEQRRRSPHTLSAYRRDLTELQQLLAGSAAMPERSDFVRAFKTLSQHGLSAAALARRP